MIKRCPTALFAVLLLVIGGCSSHKSSASNGIRLPETVNGVRLDPPPSGSNPAFSERRARATLATANDLKDASRVDAVLAVVTSGSTDHVLAWVFIGYDVPFVGKGGGGQGKATIVEPVGIKERRPLLTALKQSS